MGLRSQDGTHTQTGLLSDMLLGRCCSLKYGTRQELKVSKCPTAPHEQHILLRSLKVEATKLLRRDLLS